MVLSSSSRPATPLKRSATPTTTSTRSRTTSPTKASSSSSTCVSGSSLNSSVRPASRATTATTTLLNKKSTSTLSNTSSTNNTNASPTKRDSSTMRDRIAGSSSTSTLRQPASTTSVHRPASRRNFLNSHGRNEMSDGGDNSFATSDGASSDEDEGEDKPVRMAGFGRRHPSSVASSSAQTMVTDDETGIMTCKETSATSLAEDDGEDDEEEPVDGKAVNVVVCLRVRPTRVTAPSASIYKYDTPRSALSFASNHPVFVKRGATSSSRPGEYEFSFDRLHTPPAPSEELYDAKIRPIVRAAMNGFNGTVFAYGQTASGKTHTMMGNEAEPGIIPLAIDELFTFIHRQNDSRSFSLRVSFLEIYNEQLRDLLVSNPKSTKALEVVGEDGTVKGLEERPVAIPSEVLALVHEGDQRRRVGATDWNERSSRSHSVFVVTIESMPRSGAGMARTSRLNLIDLAGSESATGQDDRRKEGSFINKSLLTLGTVIGKLSEGKGAGAQHIPYRDSKLTRLLQPALSGKSRVAVICTMSPDAEQATETLSTLKFARRAKMVVTKAERGVLMTDQMMLNMYEKQVEELKQQIAQRESAVEESELARQRDMATARAHELESRSKKAEDELALKELELTRLREQLEHTKSFILTGPVLEANARRVSVGGTAFASSALSPSRGKRIASDMSTLGLGTPRGSRMNLRAGSSSLAELAGPRSGSLDRSQQIELERQLEEANGKLAELEARLTEMEGVSVEAESLRTRFVELQRSVSLAHVNAETSAADKRERVRDFEQQLAEAKEKLRDAGDKEHALEDAMIKIKASRDELKGLRKQLDEAQEVNLMLTDAKAGGDAAASSLAALLETVRSELIEAQDEVSEKRSELEKKSRSLLDSESNAREATKQFEALQKSSRDTINDLEQNLLEARQGQDESTQLLEGELTSTRKALEEAVASKISLVHSAEVEAAAARQERDVALDAAANARAHVAELEKMLVQRDRLLAEARDQIAEDRQSLEKKATLVLKLTGELTDVRKALAEREAKVEHLQRLVDQHVKREADIAQYEANRRAGAESLQARLAAMQSSSSRASSSLSSSQRSSKGSSGSSGRLSAGKDLESVDELRARNGELVARIEELERLLETTGGNRSTRSSTPVPGMRRSGSIDLAKVGGPAQLMERKELHSIIDTQRKDLQQSKTAEEEYRLKFLAAQKLLDKLNLAAESSRSDENRKVEQIDPRSPLDSPRSSLAELNLSNEARRPALISRTTTGSSSNSSVGSMQHHLGRSTWTRDVPPPLPCSPRNADKERQHRRVTISKEIDQLRQAKEVVRKREGFDTPPGSPTKRSMGRFVDEQPEEPKAWAAGGGLRSKKESYE